MRYLAILLAAMLIVGCSSDDKSSTAKSTADKTAMTAEPAKTTSGTKIIASSDAGDYFEISRENKGTTRLWVVGSKATADKVVGGHEPAVHVTKIGYGPNKETVKFEADANGIEKRLTAEFDKRHGKTGA